MTALQTAQSSLSAVGIENARFEAQVLLAHILGISRERLLMESLSEINPEMQEKFEAAVARRAKREPLSHITGKREFYGLEFVVSPDVLDPRADSETLIETVLSRVLGIGDQGSEVEILDLGTGSGCLLLTLLTHIEGSQGTGIDISAKALQMMKRNAEKLALLNRIELIQGDFSSPTGKKFDIIISNPPYIPTGEIAALMPEVRDFEPKIALDGGKDGLDCYRKIAQCLPSLLKQHGFAVLEIGIGQAEAVSAIMKTAGLRVLEIRDDLAGIARCMCLAHIYKYT